MQARLAAHVRPMKVEWSAHQCPISPDSPDDRLVTILVLVISEASVCAYFFFFSGASMASFHCRACDFDMAGVPQSPSR